MEFNEIEYKYDAENIDRTAFDSLVRSVGTLKKELTLHVNPVNGKNSIDHYCSNGERFMRWREGQDANGNKTWELTSKRRLNKLNNNNRKEVNLPLNTKDMSLEKAVQFSEMHELEYDFGIIKEVQVFWMGKVVLSHYTTYNLTGKKLNTFMEIEADEKYSWESEEQAFTEINEWEKKLAPLGITPQHRIKKSLFEFYTKFK